MLKMKQSNPTTVTFLHVPMYVANFNQETGTILGQKHSEQIKSTFAYFFSTFCELENVLLARETTSTHEIANVTSSKVSINDSYHLSGKVHCRMSMLLPV